MRGVVLGLALAVVARGAAFAATPPAGFIDTVLFSANTPTAIAYEPGSGAAFVLEKGNGSAIGPARILRRDAVTGLVTTALTLPCVDSAGERGLLGIAFDPDYLQPGNRYVYLYYTRGVAETGAACAVAGVLHGGYNWVVRYRESGGLLTGEEVLLRGPQLQANNHDGGTVRFAPDKTLFASMGDNDTDAEANPAARDLNDLRGKILRIRRDGSIPADNPFVGQAGKRGEIWAWGLRNPFRFSIDRNTGIPWIADVGEARWEEIDRGVKGADYGWPCYEGTDSFRTCSAPSAVFPAYAYGHGQTPPVTGEAIVGGPVYRNGNFPSTYEGRLFFGDYEGNWIRSGAIAQDGTVGDIQMFIPDAATVVDVEQAPSGCLAWVSLAGAIHETCFTTAGPNKAPVPVASADPVAGPAPLTVQFTGSGSSDPDGDELAYSWTFGDGTTSNEADPSHTYAAGVYTARLAVNDQRGTANSSAQGLALHIVSGNRAPIATIHTPQDGVHYNAGDTISYSGEGTDPEQGALPASRLSWTIVFHHDTHTHPFIGPVTGSSGSFVIPTNGEDATDVWFRIHLTATDNGTPVGGNAALATSTYVDVLPNVSTITLDASPAGQGLKVTHDGTQSVAPVSFDSVVGFPRSIQAPSPQSAGGRTWAFVHWSDAVKNVRTIPAPASDTTYTAIFRCTANCAGLPDQDGDGVAAASGDCDDTDPAVRPGAADICDGKNNDCAGGADDATCASIEGPQPGVDGRDLALLGRSFGTCAPGTPPWSSVDYNKDGCLDGNDLSILSAVWGCTGTAPICD